MVPKKASVSSSIFLDFFPPLRPLAKSRSFLIARKAAKKASVSSSDLLGSVSINGLLNSSSSSSDLLGSASLNRLLNSSSSSTILVWSYGI